MTNYEKWLSKHTINAYMTECAALRAQGKCQICPALSEFYCGEYEIEIIGNKFENSELVEVEE